MPATPSFEPTPPAPAAPVHSFHALRQMGAALHQRPFRYFLAGALLSNIGSWMQSVAQAWLVLQLTDSAFFLGLDAFAGTIPISLFAFWGGVIADRFDRRRLLMATQWVLLSLAFGLGLLVHLGAVRVWQVIVFSFLTGLTQAVSWPVYQAMMGDIVPRAHLSNAIALNSAQFNLARTIGPVAGALALHWLGMAGCFYANGVSFLFVIAALSVIAPRRHPRHALESPAGFLASFRDGLRHMMKERALAWLLLTMALGSVLGVPLVTLLPVFARDILQIGPSGLGQLVGAFGAGAVAGGLGVAYRADFPRKGGFVLRAVFVFVAAMIGFALSRHLAFSLLFLFAAGFAMVSYASVLNTLVQTSVPDHLRGRALSVFVFAFAGFMPLGNLLAGWSAHVLGAPQALIGQGVLLGLFTLVLYLRRPDVRALA